MAKTDDSPRFRDLLLGPVPEFLFVLLPLVILAIVFVEAGKVPRLILASPEWAFGAAVLFGQAITKLVSGTSRQGVRRWDWLVLIIAVVIVIGLAPSLTVLALILKDEAPGNGLVAAQLILFIAGAVVFFLLGALGHYAHFFHRN